VRRSFPSLPCFPSSLSIDERNRPGIRSIGTSLKEASQKPRPRLRTVALDWDTVECEESTVAPQTCTSKTVTNGYLLIQSKKVSDLRRSSDEACVGEANRKKRRRRLRRFDAKGRMKRGDQLERVNDANATFKVRNWVQTAPILRRWEMRKVRT